MQKKCYVIFDNDYLWLEQTAAGWQLPNRDSLQHVVSLACEQALLHFNETLWCAIELTAIQAMPLTLTRISLRDCAALLEPEFFKALGKAKQLQQWQQTHRFCGRCGNPTISADQGKARECPACHLQAYPRVSPCIMVAIYRDDELLLARSPHFRPHLYSVLAGFIEAGESAEECVHREVHEEVGIKIGPLQYFGSQPWPFPHQLMLAYSAPYLAGELHCDPVEIEDAQWFKATDLPLLSEPHTLSYQLIQHVIKTKL